MVTNVQLALSILSQPEVSREEMKKRVKAYLDSLTPVELQQLKVEAAEGVDGDEWADKIDILEQLGFVDKEIEAYAKCRFTTPGIRLVIARRTLLCKMLKMNPMTVRAMPYAKICQLEDKHIGLISTDEMVERLRA